MSESASSRRLGGIFHKKSYKIKGENPVVEKKKKHKRQLSVRFAKDWNLDNCKTEIDRNRLSEAADGKRETSDARASNEKKKPKNTRRRLPFGRKPKSLEKQELNSAEDAGRVLPEKPPLESNELETPIVEHKGDTEIEIPELTDEGDEQIIANARPEVAVEEALPLMIAEIVPQERAGILSPEPCPDGNTLPGTIPNSEGYSDHEDKIGPVQKELVFSAVKQAHDDVISLNSQCEICVYVYDLSLGNLIGLWSFVVCRAGDATKQLLLYFISSLIKRYPHCFKVQVKKGKRRSKNAQKGVKVCQTTQVESVENEE